MKWIKSIFFLVILLCISFLFYWIGSSEKEEMFSVDTAAIAPLPTIETADSVFIEKNDQLVASTEDFEALYERNTLQILKSGKQVYSVNLPNFVAKDLLVSDLNRNGLPEFWLYGRSNTKRFHCYSYEYRAGKMIVITFPALKGRQSFGYVGEDSLYFGKSYLIRAFTFKNDMYADIGSGVRLCFYHYGEDKSFNLKKTLDLENLTNE